MGNEEAAEKGKKIERFLKIRKNVEELTKVKRSFTSTFFCKARLMRTSVK